MTNDNSKNEHEYQFSSEEEYVSTDDQDHQNAQVSDTGSSPYDGQPESGKQSSSAGVFSGLGSKFTALADRIPVLKNKKVLLILCGVVFVIVAFSFMRSPNQNKIVPVKKAASPMVRTAPPVSKVSPAMTDQMQTLQSNLSASHTESLEANRRMRSLQLSVNQMSSEDGQLVQLVSAMQKEIGSLKTKLASRQAKHAHVKKPKPLVYVIQAIIPGRAWLVGPHHLADTVAIGDHLKDYGRILSLNADQGQITTSSGRVIVYGQDDD